MNGTGPRPLKVSLPTVYVYCTFIRGENSPKETEKPIALVCENIEKRLFFRVFRVSTLYAVPLLVLFVQVRILAG